MRRREVITLFGVAAAAWPLAARGQQSGERRRRIGVLTPAPAQFNSETLLRALEQRGHKEGVNLVLAVASAEGRLERLTALAEEMSRGEFDVVVTVNTPATRAILAVPGTAPVVMAMVSDPIVLGFVDNLSRPTGRVTGVANMIHDLAQKRLALLKEAAPSLGLEVSFLPVREAKEVESAFREALASRADAFFVVAGQSGVIAAPLVELSLRHRVPAAVPLREHVRWGGLMSYSADEVDHWERVADQIDRLLRGASPAQIPVEQPTKFNLVLNLRTAREIGIEFPPTLLARADEVME